eukprot:11907154-Karenia_brevis.AAC.1
MVLLLPLLLPLLLARLLALLLALLLVARTAVAASAQCHSGMDASLFAVSAGASAPASSAS